MYGKIYFRLGKKNIDLNSTLADFSGLCQYTVQDILTSVSIIRSSNDKKNEQLSLEWELGKDGLLYVHTFTFRTAFTRFVLC